MKLHMHHRWTILIHSGHRSRPRMMSMRRMRTCDLHLRMCVSVRHGWAHLDDALWATAVLLDGHWRWRHRLRGLLGSLMLLRMWVVLLLHLLLMLLLSMHGGLMMCVRRGGCSLRLSRVLHDRWWRCGIHRRWTSPRRRIRHILRRSRIGRSGYRPHHWCLWLRVARSNGHPHRVSVLGCRAVDNDGTWSRTRSHDMGIHHCWCR